MSLFYWWGPRAIQGIDTMDGRVLSEVSQKMTTQMACGARHEYNKSNRILGYHCIYFSAVLLLIRLALMGDDTREVMGKPFNSRVFINNVLWDCGRDGGN